LEKFLKRKFIRQYPVKEVGLRTRVDAFDPSTNSIYEFLGDYWHGNLEVFDPTKINESTKTSFYELNAKTFIRLNKLKDLGYKVHYIWESDFLKSKFLNLFAL
jgi:G:T-mismatch repair DNA endonuclease (very short patch repair protein)